MAQTKRRVHLLLATSSVAALIVGAGTPPAFACDTGPFPQTSTGNTACIVVNNTSFSGILANTGTISPGPTGINVENSSTITGRISNAGTISVSGTGILIQSSAVVTGGITNSGTISAGPAGIVVGGNITFPSLAINQSGSAALSSFSGGITNSGTISASAALAVGIQVGGNVLNGAGATDNSGAVTVSLFSGDINNSGTITGSSIGVEVGGSNFIAATADHLTITISTFSGNIINSGMISALDTGVLVGGRVNSASVDGQGSITISNFSGGITNSGTITAGGAGIEVGGQAEAFLGATPSAAVTISTFSGGIANSGTIFAGAAGIEIGGSVSPSGGAASTASLTIVTFLGGITNSGTISAGGPGILLGGIVNTGSLADGGLGTITILTFAGGISNSGTITAGGAGIEIGGSVTSATGAGNSASVTVSAFSGGIVNGGFISSGGAGIQVGGSASVNTAAGTTASVDISTFSGGITNSGTVSAGRAGILVGGDVGSSTVVDTDYRASVTVATFLGGITNSGMLSATGDGIVVGGSASIHGGIDNGAHITIETFSGGITNGGTISAGGNAIWVGGNASVSNGGITNAATVVISNFSGGISNSGTITAGGSGIFVGGNASVTGVGTSNTAIVAIVSFSGGISNSGRIIANTGILVNNVATFSGVIANSGTISGVTGILVQNAPPLSIFDSGIIIGSGGTAVNLSGNAAGNTFTLGPGYSIIGNVIGAGNDIFQLGGSSSGAFDLSTVPTQYSGFNTFNVVSGLWTVSNIFGQSQAWNVLGGTLAGTGTLPAVNVNSGGTLAPGIVGVPGTIMTVTGPLAFTSGAFYLATVGGSLASIANVGGTATLTGGTVEATFPSGATLNTYDILHSGSLGGTSFASAVSLDPNYAVSLTNTATDVFLHLTAQLGNGSGLPPNQQGVGNIINNNFNNGGSLPSAIIPLFTLTGSNLGNALSQLTGEAATGAEASAFQLMNEFLNVMLDPFVDGRGFTASGASGSAFGFAPDQSDNLAPEIARAYAAVFKAPPLPTSFDRRWHAWGTAYGGSNTAQGDAAVGSNTLNAATFGLAAGMDYRVSSDSTVGFALAGGGTSWSLVHALGTGYSEALQVGSYGVTRFGAAYVAGALAFTNNWFTTNRSALGDQVSARFAGQSYGARVESGYRIPAWSTVGITPYAALQMQDFSTPSYSESDKTGGGLGLSFAAMNATDVRTELGARFTAPTLFHDRPLIWFGQFAWAHDFVSTPALNAEFEALPGSGFTVFGAPIPHDSAITSAGARYALSPNWSLMTKFSGNFGPGYQTYAGMGTLRHTW